jgi:predicted ArsR family transcriptional regulator
VAKNTQNFVLFQLLKAGGTVSKDVIAETLGVKLMSVPVYIHELKNQFKVKIVSVRNGRKVIGYKLVETDAKVPQFRKNSIEVPKAVIKSSAVEVADDGSIPVLDKDAEITQISDREFADVRDSLGLNYNSGSGEY